MNQFKYDFDGFEDEIIEETNGDQPKYPASNINWNRIRKYGQSMLQR